MLNMLQSVGLAARPLADTQAKLRLLTGARMLRALQVLQMPLADLEHLLLQEAEENPFLIYEPSNPVSGGGPQDPDSLQTPDTASLAEHIFSQLALRSLDVSQVTALTYLVDALTQDGYLQTPQEEIALTLHQHTRTHTLEYWQKELQTAQRLLHGLEPYGLGARDASHCLQLQLEAQLHADPQDGIAALAWQVCQHPLTLVARHDVKRLSRLCKRSESSIRRALERIHQLDPKPGRSFSSPLLDSAPPELQAVTMGTSGAEVLTPLRWNMVLFPHAQPRLRLQEPAQAEDIFHGEWKKHYQSAKHWIQWVTMRNTTLQRVATTIAQLQPAFWEQGAKGIRPLGLQAVAQTLGLHVSTISRCIAHQRVVTPHGTWMLKKFFSSSVGAVGQPYARTAIEALLRQWLHMENPHTPLSDAALAHLLGQQGIVCARRTVTKYRESLGIPSTVLRRRFP